MLLNMEYTLGNQKENPETWSARDRSREASNDYYQKNGAVPMTGYNDGSMTMPSDVIGEQGQNDPGMMKPEGIKVENSMMNYLVDNNPAYQEAKNK